MDCCYQGKCASCRRVCGRRKGRRGGSLCLRACVLQVSPGTTFSELLQRFDLAETREELILELFSYCPSEWPAAVTLGTGVLWELRLLMV